LQRHLGWHRARLNFLAKALLALLAAGSVNLTKVARAFSGAGQPAPVGRLFGGLRPAQALQPRGARRLFGVRVRVAALRLPPEKCRLTQAAKRAKGHGHPGDEVVVVVGAYRRGDRADLLADYRLRWGIESFFGALKSRDFDLESTHLHHSERLERLLALLALAFGWAHRTGVWVAEHVRTPRLIAKYGRRAKSLFRLGLDALCQLLAPGTLRLRDRHARFRRFAKFLSCA
jgi:hypothetical protein